MIGGSDDVEPISLLTACRSPHLTSAGRLNAGEARGLGDATVDEGFAQRGVYSDAVCEVGNCQAVAHGRCKPLNRFTGTRTAHVNPNHPWWLRRSTQQHDLDHAPCLQRDDASKHTFTLMRHQLNPPTHLPRTTNAACEASPDAHRAIRTLTNLCIRLPVYLADELLLQRVESCPYDVDVAIAVLVSGFFFS